MAIDIYIKANNELSEDTTVFYRLTSNTAYTVNINAYSYLFTLSSTSTPYDLWYVLNRNISTKTVLPLSTLSSSESFICNSPVLCSIVITLSTNTTLVSSEISASFVRYFLSAGTFEAFPTNIFTLGYQQETLTSSNYRLSSTGVSFIGEGHTETINLSALSALPAGCSYSWSLSLTSLSATEETLSLVVSSLNVVEVNSKYSTVNVPSYSFGDVYNVPIGLKIVNADFPINSPNVYRDDITGDKTYYSHYVSTVTPYGQEYSTNTHLFESVKILTYDSEIQYSFDTGSGGDKIYLTVDRDANNSYSNSLFTASFNLALSGGIESSLNKCYSLYDTIWTWDNVDVNNLNNDFTDKPFTWGQVALTGAYPKKWRYESPTSITVTSPVVKSLTSINWVINSDNGWETPSLTVYDDDNNQTFPYNLKYEGIGTTLYTCDFYNDTNITVEVVAKVNCSIPTPGGDWVPRDVTITNSGTFDVLTYPYLTLYTPNRYVLLNSYVTFEFVGLDLSEVKSISVNDVTIPTSNIYKTAYNSTGDKSLKISVINNDNKTVVFYYSNIIKVVDKYDVTDVEVGELRSAREPLSVPFSDPPYISPNEWVVEDNINSVIEKMFDNLKYLYTRSLILDTDYDEFFGWYGQSYSISDAIIAPINLCVYKTWDDLTCENGDKTSWDAFTCSEGDLVEGYLFSCAPYENFNCDNINRNQNCLGLHCLNWKWSALKSSTVAGATWKNMKTGGVLRKKWENDGHCESSDGEVIVSQACNVEGQWNLNEPQDGFINELYKNVDCNSGINSSCYPVDLASKENIIYSATKTQIRVLSSDFAATEVNVKSYYDKRFSKFKNIQSIALDSKGTLFVLDNTLCKIISLDYTPSNTSSDHWITNIVWGGIGGLNANSRFRSPSDMAIDSNDNILVADTGNRCIKIFTNRGVWLRTISNSEFSENPPISLTVDDDNNIHVLNSKEIRIYTSKGVYISSYNFSKYSTGTPTRLSSSYNKLSIYLIVGNNVLKFFKNGVFAAYILDGTISCIEDVKSVTQDEFRNILISSKEKIIKIVDLLNRKRLISDFPDYYWDLNDVLIDKEEYVQNWVYNRSLQRMWDNIEIFRNALLFNDTTCKGRSTYIHAKNKIFIGINEIVTDSVINRVIGYLWDNFNTLLPFFDPNCKEL